MSQQEKLLCKTDFAPTDLIFAEGALGGSIEVDAAVRSTYFDNAQFMPAETKSALLHTQLMHLNGLVLPRTADGAINTVRVQTLADGSIEETLNVMLDSLAEDDSAVAATIGFDIAVRSSADKSAISLSVTPGTVTVIPGYEQQGHEHDLLAASAWFIQDVGTALYLNAGDSPVALAMCEQKARDEMGDLVAFSLQSAIDSTYRAMVHEVGSLAHLSSSEASLPELLFGEAA